MAYDPSNHHRLSIRLKGYAYSQAGAYFVTIVTDGRISLFGEIINDEMVLNDVGKMVEKIWQSLCERFPTIELGEYVVMPNHFHGIIIVGAGLVPALHDGDSSMTEVVGATKGAGTRPAPTGTTLGQIVGALKSITTHEYIVGVKTLGWPAFEKRIWQRNYYEHIIRNEDAMQQIALYIASNPARWADDNENPSR